MTTRQRAKERHTARTGVGGHSTKPPQSLGHLTQQRCAQHPDSELFTCQQRVGPSSDTDTAATLAWSWALNRLTGRHRWGGAVYGKTNLIVGLFHTTRGNFVHERKTAHKTKGQGQRTHMTNPLRL